MGITTVVTIMLTCNICESIHEEYTGNISEEALEKLAKSGWVNLAPGIWACPKCMTIYSKANNLDARSHD